MAASMIRNVAALSAIISRSSFSILVRRFAGGNPEYNPAFKYDSEFFCRHSLAKIAAKRKLLGLDSEPAETFVSMTDVEESSAEWKFVERLIPMDQVPIPPKQQRYPTPSGWIPPAEKLPDLPYYVRRTRLHLFPVYFTAKRNQSLKYTKIKNIEGDIWALESDLKQFLEERVGKRLVCQVQEAAMFVRFKGYDFTDDITQWLIKQGF